MTQTPRQMGLKAKTRKTEMGVEIVVHSPAVNVTLELDLDWDPEYFFAVVHSLPQIVEDQLEKLLREETPDV